MLNRLKRFIVYWLLRLIEKMDGKKISKNDFLASLDAILSANGLSAGELIKNAALRAGEKGELSGSLSEKAESLRKEAEAAYLKIVQEAGRVRGESLKEVEIIAGQAKEAKDTKIAIDAAMEMFKS